MLEKLKELVNTLKYYVDDANKKFEIDWCYELNAYLVALEEDIKSIENIKELDIDKEITLEVRMKSANEMIEKYVEKYC